MKYILISVLLFSSVGLFSLATKAVRPSKDAASSSIANTANSTPVRSADKALLTGRKNISSDRQSVSEHYRFAKNLNLKSVPAELHAKSAIQISVAERASSILESGTNEFTIPLSSEQFARLSINKVIERSPQDVSLMGSVAGSDRSHFHFQFIDGALQSGSIKFYENGDFYQIKATEEDELIVSFRDPNIEFLHCGCDDCAH